MRRGSPVQLLVLFLVIGAVAGLSAARIDWLPIQGSRQAGGIDFLYRFVSAAAIVIFSLVAAWTVYSVLRFRARDDDEADGAPIHGHTGVEVVWTALPALIVTAIAIVSAVVLTRNERLPPKHLTVDVIAQQFAWAFEYAETGDRRWRTLRLPLGRTVELRIQSLDVIHAFWVPQFRQKQDAVPGKTTRLVVTPTRLGRYPVICAELCGLGHATMRSWVVVMAPAAFDAWLARRQDQAAQGRS